MASATDTELVVAARAGNPDALAELLGRYLPLVYNVVGRALHGHPDVDDVVQETMLRVIRRLSDLRDPARFRAWLVAIAVRRVQDHGRATVAARTRYLPMDEAAEAHDPAADFADAAAARLSTSAERDDLLAATRWLSADERQVLALWWQEVNGQLTRSEIAEALALSPQHAAVRIQRMKAQLVLALAVLRAWRARPRCTSLARAAQGWDGRVDARFFRRLSRHVRGCETCTAAGAPFGAIERHVAGIGLLPVPVLLLRQVLAGGAAGTAGTAAAGTAAAGTAAVGSAAAGSAVGSAVGSVTAGSAAAPFVGVAQRVVGYLAAKPVAAAAAAATAAAGVLTTVLITLPPSGGDGDAAPAPRLSASVSATGPASAGATVPASAGGAGPALEAAAIFLAPDGDDAGDGSPARPYATLGKAVSVAKPGLTIYLRGGTYRPTKPVDITTSGTAAQPITLASYPGERAILDAGSAPAGRAFIVQHADHWIVRGLEIIKARHLPYVCESCQYNTFQALAMHDNRGTGFVLRGDGTVSNQILDSDFYDNHDDAGRDADGLEIIFGSGTGNLVRGCRTYRNVDDGVSVGQFTSPVTIDATWSFGNGVNRWNLATFSGSGNGFSLGGATDAPAVAHVITRSAAWKNGGYGFTESGNTGALRVTNNTAFRNVKDGFAFFYSPSRFQGNLALGNNRQAVLAGSANATGNSWNQSGWSDSVLREIDPTSAEGPRRPDGTLPATTFLVNTKDTSVGAPMTSAE